MGIERHCLWISRIDLHFDRLEKRGLEGSLKIRAAISKVALNDDLLNGEHRQATGKRDFEGLKGQSI